MEQSGDPFDLLNDDGDGIVESCFLEEEEKDRKEDPRNRSGCSLVFLIACSEMLIGG